MNAYALPESLQNSWFCLRHGQSEANMQHIIASDPATAVQHFGLTATGRAQVNDTFLAPQPLNRHTRIFSSDFKRARETALLAAESLDCSSDVAIDTRLRERYFGDFEAKTADQYKTVWQADQKDPQHTLYNVESVAAVATRMCDMVVTVDAEFSGESILVVSHGDPLQILECCFRGRDVAEHRELDPLNTAELRTLSSQPMG